MILAPEEESSHERNHNSYQTASNGILGNRSKSIQNIYAPPPKHVNTLVYLAEQEDAHRRPVIDPVELALPLPSVPS